MELVFCCCCQAQCLPAAGSALRVMQGSSQSGFAGRKPQPACTGAGLTSYGSQICMTNALRFARAAPALAMSYVSVIITLIYGYFIFNEVALAPHVSSLHLLAVLLAMWGAACSLVALLGGDCDDLVLVEPLARLQRIERLTAHSSAPG